MAQQNPLPHGAGAPWSRECPGHPRRCFGLVVTLPLPGAQLRHPQPLPDLCQHTSTPGVSLCPQCQPQPPWLGSHLLWCPLETPRVGRGWDSPTLDLQPWLPSWDGRAGRFPDYLRELIPDGDGSHLEWLHVPCPHLPQGCCCGARGEVQPGPVPFPMESSWDTILELLGSLPAPLGQSSSPPGWPDQI